MSENEGNVYYLNKMSAPKVLGFKVDCPIILIENFDDKLVNGLKGTIRNLTTANIEVVFIIDEKSINVHIEKTKFTKFDPNTNTVLAQRRQFPIRLAYGITIHKAQGMPIPVVEIDCCHAHYPGQIGVAVGRAVSIDELRILNYKPSLCRRHPQKIYDYLKTECLQEHFLTSLDCCCKTDKQGQLFEVTVGTPMPVEDSHHDHSDS